MKITKNWVPQYDFSWNYEDETTINKMYYLLDTVIETLEKIEVDSNSVLHLRGKDSNNHYTISMLKYLKDKMDELHSINEVTIDREPSEFTF